MKPGYFAIDLCLIPLAATAAPVATPYADNNGALAPASQYNGPLFKLSRTYLAKAGTPAMHRARGVIVVDRGGFGYVRRRARLSTAWGQECLCHRGWVVSDFMVVESDVDYLWAGAGSGGES
jgi:hypothetical protein